jgi:Tol biopolymer transport system component
MESVAGREALVVDWTYIDNSQPSFRAWLDTSTALILRLQEFGKEGGNSIQGERVVNQVVYDKEFDQSLFGIPSVPLQFGDATGGLATVEGAGAGPTSGKDALGELYFFTLPHQLGQSVQLVHLPGSCAVGVTQCPQLESVSVPFPFNFNFSALSWSPDGKLAAFAYSDHPNGTPTKLWLFDPFTNTWRSIAEFPYIDPPFWSPDGTWIAFRVQDGKGGEAVYAIHRDGSELKDLTASAKLPVEGRPYVMDGWLTKNIIVRSALPGDTAGVYLLRVSDGTVRPMFNTLLTKAVFVVSPDNAWLVYDDYDINSQKHSIKVIEPDGANPVELISFAGGSLYPLIWSPDGNRIAFAHSSNDANFNPTADVYVIGRDGRGMAQVYEGTTVGRILYSPDGQYLLIEETTSATGGHLFSVNLNTLEQKILSAPGLTLDTDWYAPSWRP